MRKPRDRFAEVVARAMPEEGRKLVSEAAATLGRLGAAKVNAARTPQERRRLAQKAVRSRWRRWRQRRRMGASGIGVSSRA